MKKFRIILAGILIGFIGVGCNDDFMEKYPLDQINDENFWSSEGDLEVYNNQLYANNIIGFGNGWADATIAPYGYHEALAYHDVITDNAAPLSYSRVAANEYRGHVTGGSGSGGWSWGNIRSINIFLQNYNRVEADDHVKNLYLGEVLFFKAWDYYKKVKTFGSVPWITEVLETDSEALMAPRTPREQVVDSIMYSLDKAIEYLPEKGSEKRGRLNKDVALHLKSQVGLYEGTYRKYHSELGIGGGEELLRASAWASEELMNNGYSLYTTGDTDNDYNQLFSQYSYDNNPEVVFWKEYSEDEGFGSAFSRYYAHNLRAQHGATRDFVDTYLSLDGLPISESPLFKGKDSIQLEFQNRDPRLKQTVANFGTYNLRDGVQGADNAPLPNIPGLSGNKVPTGYRVAKWFLNDPTDWDRVTLGEQAALIFRYAEVLLNYAEAKYELGEMDQGVLDNSINLLRQRVDMPDLKIDNIVSYDPDIDDAYAKYADYTIEPVLREIRRERRVEMAFEGTRWDDLMRWKLGKFLEKPVLGMKFVQQQFPSVVVNQDIFLNEDGFIEPYAETLPSGRAWNDRQYLFPIPIEDLVLNPNLEQNPGWEAN